MILLQIMTAVFAFVLAWHEGFAVRRMIVHGAKKWEEREFHASGGLSRLLWAVVVTSTQGYEPLRAVGFCLLLLLIMWLVFDIALNLFIGHTWDYLGTTAKLDRLVKNGKVKAAVLLILITALNLLV